jgi:hypothetical protein
VYFCCTVALYTKVEASLGRFPVVNGTTDVCIGMEACFTKKPKVPEVA